MLMPALSRFAAKCRIYIFHILKSILYEKSHEVSALCRRMRIEIVADIRESPSADAGGAWVWH
jgi:hypothetical protein